MRFLGPARFAVSVLLASLAGAYAWAENLDGQWSVRIVVEQGPCVRPPLYRYAVKIEHGIVKPNSGDSGTIITGRVDENGTVRASVTRGVDRASGTGHLSGDHGSGTWNSPTKQCSGLWTAERQ